MQTIRVGLKKQSYKIIIGSNIINSLCSHITGFKNGFGAYVISNEGVIKRYGRLLNEVLRRSGFKTKFKTVADSEKSKSIKTASAIIQDLMAFDKKRKVFIIAFGGGVVGDLSGFVASIYKRGIPYIQIPTTLLAQVDSSIGGKTAVDLTEGKNLVGTFYQPWLVFSDVATLKTLDLKQLRSGLAEVIKYAAIKDRVLFAYLEKKLNDILNLNKPALEHIVARCSRIKAKIIQQDERETKGIRTVLNFGHTIGHAIEAAGSYKRYNHGEAVALGMLTACSISNKLGLSDIQTTQRIETLIKSAGLPTKIRNIALPDIVDAHYRDKKFSGNKNRFVLIKSIGRTKIVRNVPLKIIKDAINERL